MHDAVVERNNQVCAIAKSLDIQVPSFRSL